MKLKIDLYVISKVREKRLKKGISQVDLANEFDVSVGFIGKIESNKYASHFNIRNFNLLGKTLECSSKNFLPEQPNKFLLHK